MAISILVSPALRSAAGAELKVGIVDLQRVVGEYYKAEESRLQLQQLQVSFEKELKGMRLEGQKLLEEVASLRGATNDLALSVSAREEKKKELVSRIQDVGVLEQRLEEFRNQSIAQLQRQSVRMNQIILEDVSRATADLGEKERFHLILNANRAIPAAADVVFFRGLEDVTPKLVSVLNATKPRR
jgi:Skp family chaperone for outer membrane proteins